MPVVLEGGCLVAGAGEAEPLVGRAISLSTTRVADGLLRDDTRDQMLYVLAGAGSVEARPVGPDTGVYVPAGIAAQVGGALTLACAYTPAERRPGAAIEIVRLADCPSHETGDRSYRELISARVTQFVGDIPPGRAPDHYHHYEEMLVILAGVGRMWAGRSHAPLAPGSCVYLPRGQVHCVENTGGSTLRLLGVFYPAGSPAVRYET